MSEDTHEKAASLIATSRVEELSEADRAWLEAHLEACAQCAKYAASLDRAVTNLRSFTAGPDPAVMEATRRRVRIRAMELREQRARWTGLWIACAFSWLLGAGSAPLLWMAFGWLGTQLDLPKPLWIAALGAFWIMPAVAGAAALAWQKSRIRQENDLAQERWR